MNRREKILAYGSWAAVCLIWGTTYLAIRVAVRTIPDTWLSGVRFFIAGALMCGILRIRGSSFPPFSQWGHIAVVGISLIGLGNWCVVWAEKFVPSGPTALLVATTPFWMLFMESYLAPKLGWLPAAVPSAPRQIMGMIAGFGGVLLLVLPQLQATFDTRFLQGIFVLQIGCISWAAGSLYSKYREAKGGGPLVNASLQMLLGGAFMCIIALFKGDFHEIAWNREAVVSLLYLLFVGSMIAYVCYIYALAKLPSSTVSLYGYINPMIAVWLGWLILNEAITVWTILATAVNSCQHMARAHQKGGGEAT